MRYVVAVADEGGFARAARRLHMAQPPLSRQIAELERQLGVQLFERRPTRLTAAGKTFVESARQILADADRLAREVQVAGSTPSGTVTLGYMPASGFDTVPALVRAVQDRYPSIEVVANEQWSPERALTRESDRVDLALTRCAAENPDLEVLTLRHEHLQALLSASHPLADRAEIALADLAGHTFCYFPRRLAPAYFDHVLGALNSTGQTFTVWENPIPNDPRNFTVIPSSTAQHVPAGLTVLQLSDALPRVDLQLLWNPANTTPATAAVIEVARELAVQEGWR
jgi:DNA-binding transcriptional LysR family regulator